MGTARILILLALGTIAGILLPDIQIHATLPFLVGVLLLGVLIGVSLFRLQGEPRPYLDVLVDMVRAELDRIRAARPAASRKKAIREHTGPDQLRRSDRNRCTRLTFRPCRALALRWRRRKVPCRHSVPSPSVPSGRLPQPASSWHSPLSSGLFHWCSWSCETAGCVGVLPRAYPKRVRCVQTPAGGRPA
jgi:hypothetical protein